jgi:hypothetical protein
MSDEMIADVRWHSNKTEDLSDYEGQVAKEDPPSKTLWQRCQRFFQRLLRRESGAYPIPACDYDAGTNRTVCFFDVELRDPLPLDNYAAYWGYVDSVITEGGIRMNDGWPLPDNLNAILKPLVGYSYRFRVINPKIFILSCWVDGQPDPDGVLLQTKVLLWQ